MKKTKIQWTDATWNPITGCTKFSEGCQNCYAERMTNRLQLMECDKYAAGFNTVVCHEKALGEPAKWKKPRKIFVNSMSDFFHGSVSDEFRLKIIEVIRDNPQHIFQILTKRAAVISAFVDVYCFDHERDGRPDWKEYDEEAEENKRNWPNGYGKYF